MYKQVLTPDKNNHSIELPEEFFGKKVEVIILELEEASAVRKPPAGRKIKVDELFESFGDAPEFPSIDEIRSHLK